jgi:hypothetical protein
MNNFRLENDKYHGMKSLLRSGKLIAYYIDIIKRLFACTFKVMRKLQKISSEAGSYRFKLLKEPLNT